MNKLVINEIHYKCIYKMKYTLYRTFLIYNIAAIHRELFKVSLADCTAIEHLQFLHLGFNGPATFTVVLSAQFICDTLPCLCQSLQVNTTINPKPSIQHNTTSSAATLPDTPFAFGHPPKPATDASTVQISYSKETIVLPKIAHRYHSLQIAPS